MMNYIPYQGMIPQQMPQQMPYNVPQPSTRYVNDFNEIQVNEIPMDGTYKLFAKKDMSEVQAKAWMPNGTISTINYVVDNKPMATNLSADPNTLSQNDLQSLYEPLMAEIKALNDKIDKLTTQKRKGVEKNDAES